MGDWLDAHGDHDDGIFHSMQMQMWLVIQPTPLILLGLSVLTVYLAALRSLAMPLVGSVVLVVMFFLFSTVSQIFTLFAAASSCAALIFALFPVTNVWKPPPVPPHVRAATDDSLLAAWRTATWQVKATIAMAVAISISWLFTGNWVLNNILGCSMCMLCVSLVRLPNLKVCSLLLAGLFFYDVFWVFFSSRFFGTNVMLHVAQQKASNPLSGAAQLLHLKVPSTMARRLELPVKLRIPHMLWSHNGSGGFSILGLGDMALPGLLLSLAICFDQELCSKEHTDIQLQMGNRRPSRGGYLRCGLSGYAVGMVLTNLCALASRSPQPALMYLVPCVVLPVVLRAWQRGELRELWHGPRPGLCQCCPQGRRLKAAAGHEL